MIKDRTIVCLSIRPYETPQQTSVHELMREFARCNRVLFVERTQSLKDLVGRTVRLRTSGNLWILTPPPLLPIEALPEGGLYAAATRANAAVLRASVLSALAQLRAEAELLWVGFDLPAGAALAGTLGELTCVYHCLDEVRSWPSLARHGPALERKLAGRAHVVFAESPSLARAKRHLGVPVVYLPGGIDHDSFAGALAPEVASPRAVAALPRPIMAYAGPLDGQVDFRLLEKIALAFPSGTLVLGGSAQGPWRERLRILETLPNVASFGSIAPCELPAFLKAIDVGLVPFRRIPDTRCTYPVQAQQYLALGKPVVSTDFADLGDLSPPVRVASRVDAVCFAIRAALAEDAPGAALARSRFAAQNSWRRRAEQASAVLEGLLESTASGRPW